MQLRLSITLFLLFLVKPPSLWTQSISNIPIEKITINDGLSQGMIFHIIQDRQGFIWVGTGDGLNKYDGYTFTPYLSDTQDTTTLSASNTSHIFEDNRGGMWIKTSEGGIDHFNPATEHIVHYSHDPENNHSLSDNTILSILEDSRGYMWISTFNGFNLFDHHTKRFHRFFNTRDGRRRFGKMTEDDAGNIYIQVPAESKIMRIHFSAALHNDMKNNEIIPDLDFRLKEELQFQLFSYKKNDTIPDLDLPPMFIDTNNHFYIIGTRKLYRKDLRKPDSEVFEEFSYPQSKYLRRLRGNHTFYNDDKEQKLWLGGDYGLYCFDKKENYFSHHIISGKERDKAGMNIIIPYADDGFFLTGTDDIFFFDRKTKKHHIVADHKSQEGIQPVFLFADQGNVIWLGTNGEGIRKLYPHSKAFDYYGKNSKIRNDENKQFISTVYEDREHRLWINSTSQWSHVDRTTGKWTSFEDFFSIDRPIKLTNIRPLSFLQTRDHTYWFCSMNQLWQYDPETKQLIDRLPKHLKNIDRVGSLFEDKQGTLWYFSNSETSVHSWDSSTQQFILYPTDSTFREYAATGFFDIVEEKEGCFWSATSKGLVYFETETQYFKLYPHDPDDPESLRHHNVISLLNDPSEPEHYLWVGTYGGGLQRLDKKTGKFKSYSIREGLPNNVIYGILTDKSGHLWISTNKGLSRFDPNTETFRNYTSEDGLQGNEFNRNACFQSKSGEMFFGGAEGLTAFFPEKIKDNTHRPPIRITDFRLDNRSVSNKDSASVLSRLINYTDHITLRHDQNMIGFSFAALDYVNPEKNFYTYKLEGLDKGWSPPNTLNQTTYTNLDPGDYTFMVKGSNSDGIWNETPTSLTLTILPPWWATWWAYLLYFITGTAITCVTAYFLIKHAQKRREARQLRELDEVKTRFFSNITHEFRTPLTLVIGPVEQMITELPQGPFKRKLQNVSKNAHDLLGLINQLLDLSKLENRHMKVEISHGDIIYYTKELVYRFLPLANSKKLNLDFSTNVNDWETYFDKEKWNKIVHNLISNAIKFTREGGNISAKLEKLQKQDQEYIQLQIKDTGIGIKAENLPHIFDRFYQADATSTRVQGGTGIGLSLVKELTELQNGDITVTSTIDLGSTFTVKIPIEASLSFENIKEIEVIEDISLPVFPKEIIENADATITENGEKEKLELLIIEDNTEMRTYIRSCIDPSKYNITEAADGEEGIQRALEIVPDLIISDIMMPKKDGFEVTRAIRNHIVTSHIPLILLTARASLESRLEGISRGADAYLTKPFSPKELTLRVRKLIEFRKFLQARYQSTRPPDNNSELQKEDGFIIELKEYITEHISEADLSGEAISRRFAMSRMQLYRKVKTLTDNTPGNYIRSIRLNIARQLLEERKLNVTEIAYQTGFTSTSHFSNTFKKHYGKSPSEFSTLNN